MKIKKFSDADKTVIIKMIQANMSDDIIFATFKDSYDNKSIDYAITDAYNIVYGA